MFNKKVRLLLIIIMLLNAILSYPVPASACSCVEPHPPQEAFARADAVFVGTVTGTGDASWNPLYEGVVGVYHQFVPPLPPMMHLGINDRAVSFDLEHSWRGVKTTHFTVRTGQGGDDCGYHFEQDQQYLVYADQWGDDVLHASSCSRTAPLASATEDLNHLETLPKLELTYVPPMFNPLMLGLALLLVSTIPLGVVSWHRSRRKPIT